MNGIDVSHWQVVIDWQKVKEAGIGFAFIKATEGNRTTDSRFAENWRKAQAAGISRGAYHYFRFGARNQAQFFLKVMGSDRGELPPVVDVEDTGRKPDLLLLKQFIDTLVAAGARPMIYTAAWFWNNARWGGPVPWAEDYDLWVAHYTTAQTPLLPTDWHTWRFWQYSNSGTVAGINAAVDLDRENIFPAG